MSLPRGVLSPTKDQKNGSVRSVRAFGWAFSGLGSQASFSSMLQPPMIHLSPPSLCLRHPAAVPLKGPALDVAEGLGGTKRLAVDEGGRRLGVRVVQIS